MLRFESCLGQTKSQRRVRNVVCVHSTNLPNLREHANSVLDQSPASQHSTGLTRLQSGKGCRSCRLPRPCRPVGFMLQTAIGEENHADPSRTLQQAYTP